MTGWVDGPMVGFDTETTGVDYNRDLILSSSIVNIPRTGPVQIATEYLDHKLQDPVGGHQIHKMDAAFLAEHGDDPGATLEAICEILAIMVDHETPLVGMNIVFDLTMLDRNCRRFDVQPLTSRITPFCVDALVLDKGCHPYRKGKRNLQTLATKVYMVPWNDDEAHTSAGDALAAARVAWRIGRVYPALGALSVPQVHELQMEWKKAQDESFARYKQDRNEPVDGLDGHWPVKPLLEVVRHG